MFTGLVETTGRLRDYADSADGRRLRIEAPAIAGGVAIGDSVAVNGCCLTVTTVAGDALSFDLLAETLRATNLGGLQPGDRVNLERALPAAGRLGGHFVQGHVDCASEVVHARPNGPDLDLAFALPSAFARYLVPKGSIAINGVSLTAGTISPGRFGVWIIPHTREVTNLGDLVPGDRVNLEFDLLAKYTERLLAARA